MGGCSMARSARRTSRTGASSAGKKPAAAARFGRLGDTGRYRTNVWDYAGISSIGASRADELSMHPTVKPVAMIADPARLAAPGRGQHLQARLEHHRLRPVASHHLDAQPLHRKSIRPEAPADRNGDRKGLLGGVILLTCNGAVCQANRSTAVSVTLAKIRSLGLSDEAAFGKAQSGELNEGPLSRF